MQLRSTKAVNIAVSAALAFGIGSVAMADDSEIYLGQPNSTAVPNILFILDTSGSMGSNVTVTEEYDPARTYSGSCSSTNIYYNNGGTPPQCDTGNYFPTANLKCNAATSPLAANGNYSGDRFARWRRVSTGPSRYAWQSTLNASNSQDVECYADNGTHGNTDGSATTQPYPMSGNQTSATALWVSGPTNVFNWATITQARTIYTANYLNYYNGARVTTLGTRMSIMKRATTDLLGSLNNVNAGLMRYSVNNLGGDNDAAGGMVAYAVSPIAANRTNLVNTVNSWNADGYTPLSETLYESYQYFAGRALDYGRTSVPIASVPASRVNPLITNTNYKSPVEYACQKNYVVFLTDGLPTKDGTAVESKITGLPSFQGGSCLTADPNPFDGSISVGAGRCLGAMAQHMNRTDLSSTLSGQQNVTTYFIGFGGDSQLITAFNYLQDSAARGGGRAYLAGDLAELTTTLNSIINEIQSTSTTFTSPTVAVNAFNRAQTLNEIYVSVFSPTTTIHWPGNVKRYRLNDAGIIVDANGNPAVDETTGFFHINSRELWSATTDGADVTKGGAAAQLPDPLTRDLYTYIGANPARTTPPTRVDLTVATPDNTISTTNTRITPAMLQIGAIGDPTQADLLSWARGHDVQDEDIDNDRTEARHAMGDPVHAQPAAVIYGGVPGTPDINDGVVFATTNDGYLHAIDIATGAELWSYIPQELLGELVDLYHNNGSATKHYSLDGDIRVLKYDINGDGIVDPAAGDEVKIYFGQGRGGSRYYALDVTYKNRPRFMWSLGPTELAGIGQAWSTPQIARVNVGGVTQNTQKLVLIFGGGYDPIEEGYAYQTTNSVGNKVFMVDAVYGDVLWSAGSSGADLNLTRMDHSIASRLTVLDLDGNGFADRMYVGDLAAQLWRFDIYNGNARNALVTGGVIASLGAHDVTPTAANTRRFYNAPDVAVTILGNGTPTLTIAIGSGYRGHPLDPTAQDRIYAIRDLNRPFGSLTQAEFDSATVTTDAALVDITGTQTPSIPSASLGWKLLLNQPGNAWIGEKSLASPTIFNNNIVFTTYTPNASSATNPCQVGIGTNKAYAVTVLSGAATADINGDGSITLADRSQVITQSGIAPEITFLFPPPPGGGTSSGGSGGSSGGTSSGATASSGGSGSGSGSSGGSSSSGVVVLPGSSGGSGSGSGSSSSSGGGTSSSGGSSGTYGTPNLSGEGTVFCISGTTVLNICNGVRVREKTVWSESDAR